MAWYISRSIEGTLRTYMGLTPTKSRKESSCNMATSGSARGVWGPPFPLFEQLA